MLHSVLPCKSWTRFLEYRSLETKKKIIWLQQLLFKSVEGDLLPAALDSDLKLKAKLPFQEFPAATGGPDCPVKTVSLVCLKNCEILKS